MTEFKRTLITSALPYANGPVHIGHLAGVYIPADIYARYLRMNGQDVAFIGGSDEHGVPITLKAKNEGVTPQDIVDKYHNIIKDAFSRFGISFDVYSRTSAPIHHETASEFFRKLHDEGKFIEKTSEQYYDVEAKQFLADRYITGTCPKCGNERAYGDQCEACGSTLNATDLINPKSTLSGNPPVMKETKHWYLPLDQYEDWLKEWILEGHKEWKSNVYGQCKSWIDSGLQPRAVTRDLDWGVPVPVDGAEGKVLYVWFDAPIGYISATKEWTPDWEKWWKDPETKMVHFIGKDNIVFHCIIFPAMLKAEGTFILPENVPANEFLNLEGDKISTSRNWAVWLHEYLDEFPGKEDVLKYVLTANAPETKDNDFTWKDFQTRNNNELVAVLGNFVNRALVLTQKYYDGKVPAAGELTEADQLALAEISVIKAEVEKYFTNAKFFSMHGLTEAFRSTYLDPAQLKIRPESIGKAIPDVELYVIDEDGNECAPRVVGELIHRGGYIYKGFWNAPKATQERFKSIDILKNVVNLEGQLTDEIVVKTGDYVYKDEEGYFYFVSRHDDMIKTRGFRVNPFEIESVVEREIKEVEKCAVFSIENEEIEEEIILVYSAKAELNSSEILFELKNHLASYMLPSRIIYKKSLPLVSSDKNKINKEELKKEFILKYID